MINFYFLSINGYGYGYVCVCVFVWMCVCGYVCLKNSKETFHLSTDICIGENSPALQ